MALLPTNDFCYMVSSFGNTGSLSYADLPNIDIFHYAIFFKLHLFKKENLSHQESLKCWEVNKLEVVDTSFPKF